MNTISESTPRARRAVKYELLLLLVSMIWGSAFVAQQIGMQRGLGPMTFNALRFALGCISLVPIVLWRKKNRAPDDGVQKLPTLSSVGAGVFLFAAAGFLSVGIAYTFQVVCQKRCPPAPAAIIMSLEAVFAAIAGYLVLNQTLTGRAIAGCFLILLGVLMVQINSPTQSRKLPLAQQNG